MMAMLTLVLDHAHVLDWLDAGMLRLVGARNGAPTALADPFAANRPVIVDIDRRAYGDLFDERSPLDRYRLAELFGLLDRPAVRVVAVDIDVSPALSSQATPGQDLLDRTIDRLASAGRSVVLVLPDPSPSDAKLAWIRARCTMPGIHFASPLIRERFGAVTLADTKIPTLSAVAYGLTHPGAEHGALKRRVCELAATSTSDQSLVDAAGRASEADGDLPLHPHAVAASYLIPVTTGVILKGGALALEDDLPLRDVVFVGGDYERSDRFRTADGVLSGLYVHAATFASLSSGAHRVDTLLGFLFDVFSAVVLAFLFSAVWKFYDGFASPRLARAGSLIPFSSRSPGAAWMIVQARLAIILVWAVPVALSYGAFLATHWLLLSGAWLNPGTLVIGMFLEARSHREEPNELSHPAGPDGSSRRAGWLHRLATEHPDTVVTQPLVTAVLAIVLVCQHTFH